MKIYKNALELIGNTPLVELTNIEKSLDLKAHLLAKVEAFNPGGSAKDRIALAMIDDAERSGRLSPGATIIEPTSGNTGVGLAWIGAVKGYKVILTMPETMSEERKTLLRALGAELVLTPGAEGMSGAIRKAEEIRDATPGSMIMSQFDNPANPDVHRRTTGEEIWRDTDGEVDIFVAGVGTGGTLSGVAAALKARKPEVEAIAVEPAASPVLSGGKAGAHKIQGIGAGFVPGNYDASLVDEVIEVSDDSAFMAMRELAAKEGIFAGISSGAALAAAIDVARRPSSDGKTVVVLLPDTGQRYLSML
ncbi:MAG: cysteine synthase A [Paramuribaculum sp.]|nr:cysteine synthase A [Paramuribaculum sp.]